MEKTNTNNNYWFNIVNRRWNIEHSISEQMLRMYVKKKFITPEEFEQITGFPY